VVPTLGEAGNLDLLLRKISAVLRCTEIPYEILVVDDDSCDGTEEVVSAIAVHDPRVRLFIRKGERGLSGAILHGWQRTDAAILGVMDADLQHPPELLPRLLAEIRNGHDLAIGSRYAGGGRLGEWNPVRKLISTAAIWFTWPLQRPWLRAKDPMSGYFLMRRHCVQNVMFQPAGFKLLLEILVRGHIQSVQEVPFTFGRRSHGCSKAGFRVAWEYLLLLVSLYRLRWTGMRVSDSAAGD
jgi:dolichol-phosphate mannosyltransferase